MTVGKVIKVISAHGHTVSAILFENELVTHTTETNTVKPLTLPEGTVCVDIALSLVNTGGTVLLSALMENGDVFHINFRTFEWTKVFTYDAVKKSITAC